MADAPLDLAALQAWIGRQDTAHDEVTPRLVQSFRAMLDDGETVPAAGEAAPAGIHWCLAPPVARWAALGPDGHAARGGFLPPVPLPRRMWAGGRLMLADPLRVGDAVTRRSRIVDIAAKSGRSGALCFVAVEHEFVTPRGVAVRERHDIVYRAAAAAAVPAAVVAADAPASTWQRTARTDPVQLFRYSALSFNGHRIHYDRDYATGTETYAGLVVHGPLQATLLLRAAAELRGAAPSALTFRALAPLFDVAPFTLHARDVGEELELWIATAEDVRTMAARASWTNGPAS